ncbi:MAG: hypothetical protein LDLANPLL_01836 [Turneriella sp.]|nr:hypothetical protein [Turneriella sp.]
MALKPECQRTLLVVSIFDLAIVKKTKRNILSRLENPVAGFSGDLLEIHMKSLRVLFKEKTIFVLRDDLPPPQIATNCPLPVIAYGLVRHKINFSDLSGLWVHKVARGDGVHVGVKIQAITCQVNGTQNSRLKNSINIGRGALSLCINSGRKKIQKARVDFSIEKQIR